MCNDLSWNQHYKKLSQKLTDCWGCFDAVQPVSICFCQENIIFIFGKISCYLLFNYLETNPDKAYYPYKRIQRRTTKFILNYYTSSYFDGLKKLNLLPLMYIFEFSKIICTIKSLKYPSPSFNITNYITFNDGITRSSSRIKMIHTRSSNNVNRHFFFTRILRLWNTLLPIDLSLSIATNKTTIYKFLYEHFLTNFNSDNPCTYHFLCPCRKCCNAPRPPTM